MASALVSISESGTPTLGENSGFTSVTEPKPGFFCILPVYAGHPILTTPAGTGDAFAVVAPTECSGGYEIEASSTSVKHGEGFVVAVP